MSWTDTAGRAGRITIVGNPGLDTLVILGEDHPDLDADGHYVRNVDTVGHAAAFTARACARLKHDTRILGSAGDDMAGSLVRGVLAAEGVDTSLMFVDPGGTARSVNLIRPDGRRTSFYDGGSHMTLQPPEPAIDSALSGADLVFSSLPNWARGVVARARTLGLPVAVDLQDVRDPADPYRADFVASADYLFASAAHVDDPVATAVGWFAVGPASHVVFGMGRRGTMLVQRGASGPIVTWEPPPALDLPIVDTTGAGDSLATGFLDGLLFAEMSVGQALRRGQVLARIVCSDLGGAAPFDRIALDAMAAG
ncbi:MAG: carbohydrate kinase family protein [Candidatus Nanopelagicales bacterium]